MPLVPLGPSILYTKMALEAVHGTPHGVRFESGSWSTTFNWVNRVGRDVVRRVVHMDILRRREARRPHSWLLEHLEAGDLITTTAGTHWGQFSGLRWIEYRVVAERYERQHYWVVVRFVGFRLQPLPEAGQPPLQLPVAAP